MKKRTKPCCPECNRFGKVYPTALFPPKSWACRRCNIWFVLPDDLNYLLEGKTLHEDGLAIH